MEPETTYKSLDFRVFVMDNQIVGYQVTLASVKENLSQNINFEEVEPPNKATVYKVEGITTEVKYTNNELLFYEIITLSVVEARIKRLIYGQKQSQETNEYQANVCSHYMPIYGSLSLNDASCLTCNMASTCLDF